MTGQCIFVAVLIVLQFLDAEAAANPRQPVVRRSSKSLQTRQSFACGSDEFHCGNDQCIPLSTVCDGVNDCLDGAIDEDEQHCKVIQTGLCNGRKRTKNFCDDLSVNPTTPGQGNVTQFFCPSDIFTAGNSAPLTCANGVWTPTRCTRVCEPLTLLTSNVTCLRNGVRVDCSKPLLVGTKIYPQCEFYYRPSVKEVVCQENGEWSDKSAIRCDPMCGKQFKDRMRYTREMRAVEYREFPWSIAIYYTKPGTKVPILIPGTIISPYLIVTTAINFYADYEQGLLRAESMNVVVAKRTSEKESLDDQFQKSYKVQGIYFTETGFQNQPNSVTSENIAIIELDEKLVLSPSVYPACVNWEKNETLLPQDGEIGQVPHTLTLHKADAKAITQHEVLQTLAVRFVSRNKCLSSEPMKSIPWAVRKDDFCGEPVSAPAPCDGAFVFLETNTNRFYVQGLVDGITPSVTAPLFTNTFVDLSEHIDWMYAVRKAHEDRLVGNNIHLEASAPADPTVLCSKNDDVPSASNIDTRFASGTEAGSTRETNTTEECLLPAKAQLNATTYVISCPVNSENNSCRRVRENSMVAQYTSVRLRCKEGFAVDKSDEETVCFNGQWSPTLTPCTRRCGKAPKFENGNFTCFEENQQIECTEGLKVGSKLVPRCNPAYKTERDAKSHSLVCQEDGNWVGSVPKCVKKTAQEVASPKSRNQGGPSQGRGQQQPSSRTTPNPRNSNPSPSPANRSNKTPAVTPETIQPRAERARSDRASISKNQGPQVEFQTRNRLNPEEDGTLQSPDIDDQNANADLPDSGNVNENTECSKNEFSCGELCIPLSAVCNGTAECKDGRDESSQSCKILRTDACTPMFDSPKYCSATTSSSKNQTSKEKHTFFCNAKYMATNSDGIPLNCVNGVSTPSTIPCTRVCKNVTVIASALTCLRNGVTVDCKKPLLAGTKIVPTCESDYKASFNGTTCNDRGEWDHSIIECIPECGKPSKKEVKMTKTVRPAQFREFPWNVAIYRKSKETNSSMLFAGIIISPSLVLTNAHCCTAEATDPNNMDMFQVVVGKRSSMSDAEDDDFQKSFKVKAVHLVDPKSNTERLAIIELAEKITSCPAVQAACVNWYKNETVAAKDGTVGLVPHWRTRDRTNNDTVHEMLHAVALTLHTKETCQKRLPKDFLRYLGKDAFCSEPIPLMTPAHRGAGFIYEDRATKLNYVQGITYFTGTQDGEPTTFTNMFLNISTHIDWINSIRRKTEKRIHREWILNTRITESSDVCTSNAQNDTSGNDDNLRNNKNGLSTRTDPSSDAKPDDFMENGCELPDKTWLYLDYKASCLPSRREKGCEKAEAGGIVPEFASLTLSCNEGYVTNGSEEVICFRKSWSPPVEPCKKICDKLELENVTLKCFSEDKKVECDSQLKSGATAIVECAPYHQSEKNLPKLLCDEYGRWEGASEVKCSYFNPWEEKGEYFKFSLQI